MKTNIFQQIRDYVRANPQCLTSLFPHAKQKGVEVYFDRPSYNSWSYNMNKHVVKDFRTSERQSIIDVYQKVYGFSNVLEAAKEMEIKLNVVKPMRVCEDNKKDLTTKHNIPNATPKSNPNIIKLINTIWDEGLPLGGSIAGTYLKKRRITLPFSSVKKGKALRFHPALYHSETKEKHPAMIAAIYDNDGKLSAVQRTYLDNEGNKLSVSKNKMLLGVLATFAVKINVPSSKVLAICEGIESGLSIVQEKRCTTWCALSAGNMERLSVLDNEGYESIVIYPDIEKSKVGVNAAIELAKKY